MRNPQGARAARRWVGASAWTALRLLLCWPPRGAGDYLRRDGRAVEGARLESVYTGNRIVGSNPTPSAITNGNPQVSLSRSRPELLDLPGGTKGWYKLTHVMPSPWKHPKSGVYYYRRVVPGPLREALGRTEFRISLRTKDVRVAKQKYPQEAARVNALLAQAGNGPIILTHQQIHALAGDWYRRELAAREVNPQESEQYALESDALVDADLLPGNAPISRLESVR